MSVYFIQLGRYLKVGYSETPERRHRRLFSGTTSYSAPWDCPRGLADRTLLGYVPGGKDDEGQAHRALDDFAVGCEFYLAEHPVLEYVQRCLATGVIDPRRVDRADGPVDRVGQVPPGANPWTLAELTRARRAS